MKRTTGKAKAQDVKRQKEEKSCGLLLSYQAAARTMGLTKREVASMVSDGLLKEVRVAFRTTRYLMRAAYDAGDIPEDPTRRWDMPRSAKPRKAADERIYSEERIAEILRTSKAYDQELYTMLALLECTGMRPGEMLAVEALRAMGSFHAARRLGA